MKKQMSALLIASAVVSVGLSSFGEPTVKNISSGTVTLNSSAGSYTYGGANYSWKSSLGDVLNFSVGTLEVTRYRTAIGDGIFNATGGYI